MPDGGQMADFKPELEGDVVDEGLSVQSVTRASKKRFNGYNYNSQDDQQDLFTTCHDASFPAVHPGI